MKPYGVKIIEFPDVADIQQMGAKSSVGKINRGRGYSNGNKNECVGIGNVRLD